LAANAGKAAHMHVITTTADLERFARAVADAPYLAVDTEFLRETTYWPKLCLIQAAAPGEEAVIDPLSGDLDLAPFLALLREPGIVKVFHAGRQDLEIFFKLLDGVMPAPVFDTQIAGMALGYGDSIAYDALVQALLKRKVDKTSRFTDWSRRPLSEQQLVYALADATHLRDLYPLMHGKLEALGRLDWIADELAGLVDPAAYDLEPENAWRRLKLRKTSVDYLAALRAAAAWRERMAQNRNVPRARVLKDDALYEIAEQKVRRPEQFDRLRAVPKGFGGSRHAQELADAIDAALDNAADYAPAVERLASASGASGPTIELLKVLLRYEAERHDLAPRLLANAADLEAIAADDEADTPALRGWRREVFGERALALKHGRIAMSLKRGRVHLVEV